MIGLVASVIIGFKEVDYLVESIAVQLERVQRRIAQIEEGVKEYSIGNRRLANHELTVLYAREADLKAALAVEENRSVTFAQIGML